MIDMMCAHSDLLHSPNGGLTEVCYAALNRPRWGCKDCKSYRERPCRTCFYWGKDRGRPEHCWLGHDLPIACDDWKGTMLVEDSKGVWAELKAQDVEGKV